MPSVKSLLAARDAAQSAAKNRAVPPGNMTPLAERRLHWLHSPASNNVDGYEWGIFRVKWQDGRAVEVWQTNGDFSDLDAAIRSLSPSTDPAEGKKL